MSPSATVSKLTYNSITVHVLTVDGMVRYQNNVIGSNIVFGDALSFTSFLCLCRPVCAFSVTQADDCYEQR